MGLLGASGAALTLLAALAGRSWWLPRAGAQVLKSFQEDQFQGHWFVLGLAGNSNSRADRSLLSPFTATFERSGKRDLEVSYAMNRGTRCITWSYLLTPMTQPGQFSVDNGREPGAPVEELQVHDTDYTNFALMVSKRQSGSRSILRVYLLCRMWAVEAKALEGFACLLKAQGLSEDNVVFPDSADWSSHLSSC
ncbi:lipocalin 12 [Phyllostomus discolor]|uniref:Epididymal-specific lipocalin-12 n=2 Tax=Phyllostomus discolor TaxID=89673 RepID=A0A7E6DHA9_9CHIR|nr:epididymal-specific lipocalin-12 [Phyllostomus discolor]KAF6125041.1 lipocalin 12 [Phyllostomus discolor]